MHFVFSSPSQHGLLEQALDCIWMLVPEQTVSFTTAGQGREMHSFGHVDVTTSHSFGL